MDVNSLPPGSFCWPELGTTDPKAAADFYRTVFGWDVDVQPIGPAETYSMFKMRGREVAAAYTLRDQDRQYGVPPHWNTYVSVENADAAARRAQELGGNVVAPPFDVMDAGRMAILQDPTGATFEVWQPKRHIGTRIQGEPGALCWTELATRDTRKAEAFYRKLFGWKAKVGTDGGVEYTEFSAGGSPSGGMMAMPSQVPSQVPAHWTPYFQVTDVDGTAAKATSGGGKTIVPPANIPKVGRFAMIQDPQGATFAIFKPANA